MAIRIKNFIKRSIFVVTSIVILTSIFTVLAFAEDIDVLPEKTSYYVSTDDSPYFNSVTGDRVEPAKPYRFNVVNSSADLLWTSSSNGDLIYSKWFYAENYGLFDNETANFLNVKHGGAKNFVWGNKYLLESDFFPSCDTFTVNNRVYRFRFSETEQWERYQKATSRFKLVKGQDYTVCLDTRIDLFNNSISYINFKFHLLINAKDSNGKDLGYFAIPANFEQVFSASSENPEGTFKLSDKRQKFYWDFSFDDNTPGANEYNIIAVFFTYDDNSTFSSTNSLDYIIAIYDFYINDYLPPDTLSGASSTVNKLSSSLIEVQDNVMDSSINQLGSFFDSFTFSQSMLSSILAINTVFDSFLQGFNGLEFLFYLAIYCGAFACLCGLAVSVGKSVSRKSDSSQRSSNNKSK